MSIEALNWVMRQRSRNSSTQCLLLVIANAADPEGVAFGWWNSRDHWWPYLMERTRLSRGALFRLLNEMEDLGYFERSDVKPEGGGRAQPVIRLHLDRDICEPGEAAESESTTETEQAERPPEIEPSHSTTDTEKPGFESTAETDGEGAIPPERLAESTTATARDVPVLNPLTPKSPLAPTSGSAEELNGFATFWSDYPDHQAMNRKRAMEAFAELPVIDQQLAIKAVGFYARDIAKLKRRPVSPANWLSERRFTEYGSGRHTSASSTGSQMVAEGTEPWQAWCNVAAVTFGGAPKIPYHWGSRDKPGAWRPTLWPLGGEAWLVPLDQWWFVENGTAQHRRWCERIKEMADRLPIPVRLSSVKPAKTARLSASAEQNPHGLFVPLEWPPAKGAKTSGDNDQLQKTG